MKQHIKTNFFPCIFLFIVALTMHLYFFMAKGLPAPRGGDPVDQYLIFHYFLHNMFSNGEFFWSWEYGLGGDIFGQFSYYYTTSLFFWLSLLVDVDSLKDIIYIKFFFSILKSYLAMLFMYVLLRYHRRTVSSSLIGALVYGGSVLIVTYAFYSDFMADGMVYLPMVIWSLDLFTDKKIKGVFVSFVFLIVISNFYFAFITSVYIFLYAACKYFISNSVFKIRTFFSYYWDISIYYLIGLLAGAFSFFPAVYNFLNADRFGKEIQIPFLFEPVFYENLAYNLFFRISTITPPVLCLFILAVGFRISDREIKIRFSFTLFMILLYCVPATYSFFNGFSAIQYRWLYLFVFTLAFFVPFVLDHIVEKKRVYPVVWSSLVLVLGWMVARELMDLDHGIEKQANIVLLLITSLVFIILCLAKKVSGHFVKISLLSLTAVNVLFVNFASFQSGLGPYEDLKKINENVYGEHGIDHVGERAVIDFLKKKDNTFYRIMWQSPKLHNLPMLYGYNGFSAYQSLIPYNISRFFKEHYQTLQLDSPSQFQNVDERWYLETALGAKYYVVPPGRTYKPYGYRRLGTIEGYTIYENNYYLPLGFMYSYGMDKEEFSNLQVAERDQLLLQAAVTEGKPEVLGLKKIDNRRLNTAVLHKGMSGLELQNIKKTENSFLVGHNGKIRIRINRPATEGELIAELKIKPLHKSDYHVTINNKQAHRRALDDPYSYPQESLIVNLGYENLLDTVDISLTPGEYKIDTINLFFNSYTPIPQLMEQIKAHQLKNIKYSEQRIEGEVQASEAGLLFMSIPFSKGWKVKVDGNSVDAVETNYSFIGIPLKKGSHKIELKYTTPYLKEGLVITWSTIAGYIWISLRMRRKQRSQSVRKATEGAADGTVAN